MFKKIVIASSNQGKIKEIKDLLKVDVYSQKDFNVSDVDEDQNTFLENALKKARHCAYHTNLPSLSDDSGLIIPKLNNEPGVHSARYSSQGNSQANIDKVLAKLKGECVPAYFYTILVFLKSLDDITPIIAQGKLSGTIINKQLGNNGFGYDSIFIPDNYSQTLAQMNVELKNNISHRSKALKNLLTLLD